MLKVMEKHFKAKSEACECGPIVNNFMEPLKTEHGSEYGLLDVVEKFGEKFDFDKEK